MNKVVVMVGPRRTSGLRLVFFLAGVVPAAVQPDPRENVYFRTPGLRALLDWVTFYQSFDRENLIPDMAGGDWTPRPLGQPEFAPGLLGQALVAGTGAVLYPAAGNFPVGTRGAVSLWVGPVQWDHRHAGLTNLVLSSTAVLYLERQGPLLHPDGQWERQECLLFGLQGPLSGNVMGGCTDWADGEWHLLVANWSWPRLELSVDGGPFAASELPRKPDPAAFGDLILGSEGGDRTLLDEVFCYRRPLTEGEARLIYETLRSARGA